MKRIDKYQNARSGKGEEVVIEGLHAIKHAFRFGAEFIDIVSYDIDFALALARELAGES